MTRSLLLSAGAATIAASLSVAAFAAQPSTGGWNDVQPLPLNMTPPPPPPASSWHDHGGWTSNGWRDDPMAAGDTRSAPPGSAYADNGYQQPAPPAAYAPPSPAAAYRYPQPSAAAPYGQPAPRSAYDQSPYAPPSASFVRSEQPVHAERSYAAERHGREHGDAYPRLSRGGMLPRYWMSPSYAVSNWSFYGLGEPGYRRHWIRYYDDAVLVDDGGAIVDVVDDLDWDHPAMAYGAGYVGGRETNRYGGQAIGSYYAPPAPVAAPPVYAPPPPVYARPTYAPPAYVPPPVVTYGSPVVTTTTFVSAAPVVTTTTTTTTYVDEVSYRTVQAAPRRVWHRPAPRRVTCCCLCR